MNDNPDSCIHVRKIGVTATSLLAEIHQKCFENTIEQTWNEKDFISIFSIKDTEAYIISVYDDPIGLALIRKTIDEAEIITFCILPKWSNNGYATHLLEWVINDLQQQSIKRLFLEVREDNQAAIRLYSKCSFTKIGRRKGYYNNHQKGQIDALVLQRQLIV